MVVVLLMFNRGRRARRARAARRESIDAWPAVALCLARVRKFIKGFSRVKHNSVVSIIERCSPRCQCTIAAPRLPALRTLTARRFSATM